MCTPSLGSRSCCLLGLGWGLTQIPAPPGVLSPASHTRQGAAGGAAELLWVRSGVCNARSGDTHIMLHAVPRDDKPSAKSPDTLNFKA